MSRFWPRGPRQHLSAPRPRSLFRRVVDYGLALVLLALLIVLAARLDRVETRTANGVATVVDGDSLALGGERIRLLGIDAPEYRQLCQKNGADYECGRLARNALVRLVGGAPVACAGWQHDRYGRLLADCSAGGRNLNRSMIEQGWAVAYGGYESEEKAARGAGLGIWIGSFERPQDWRGDHGDRAEASHGDVIARLGRCLSEIFSFR